MGCGALTGGSGAAGRARATLTVSFSLHHVTRLQETDETLPAALLTEHTRASSSRCGCDALVIMLLLLLLLLLLLPSLLLVLVLIMARVCLHWFFMWYVVFRRDHRGAHQGAGRA